MGKTYRKDTGYKKDRRDRSFKKSRKFKEWTKPAKHAHPEVANDEIIDEKEY